MRVKRWVYICDHCGKAELEPESYVFYNRVVKRLPKDWSKLGKEYLCPTCAETYRRFKNEVLKENDMDV
jgi:hypothetical protein